MSLDLSGKAGICVATAAITAASAVVTALFPAASRVAANKYIVKVDTSGGDVDLSALPKPSTMSFIAAGDTVVFVKSTTDSNKMIIDDETPGASFNGTTGVTYAFGDRKGESYTVYADIVNDKWGFDA